MKTLTSLYPLKRTGVRDHGDVEDFRRRQRERMRRAGWPVPTPSRAARTPRTMEGQA